MFFCCVVCSLGNGNDANDFTILCTNEISLCVRETAMSKNICNFTHSHHIIPTLTCFVSVFFFLHALSQLLSSNFHLFVIAEFSFPLFFLSLNSLCFILVVLFGFSVVVVVFVDVALSKRIRILLRIKQYLPKDTQHLAVENVSGYSSTLFSSFFFSVCGSFYVSAFSAFYHWHILFDSA